MTKTSDSFDILLTNNAAWAQASLAQDRQFFARQSVHAPKYLWLGCADARVDACTIMNVAVGDMFVHRNVGNVIAADDPNIQAVITYAVQFLQVKNLIVGGHYDCGAVKAVLSGDSFGDTMDTWLAHIDKVKQAHIDSLNALDGVAKINALCELNAKAQAKNLATSPAVQQMWAKGDSLTIHTVVYDIANGIIKDLGYTLQSAQDI